MSHNHGGSPGSSAIMVMMVPFLHTSGGDNLFFKSLHPSSAGALAGASLVLFLLAVLQRWLSAMRGAMERRWRQRALDVVQQSISKPSRSSTEESASSCCGETDDIALEPRGHSASSGKNRISARPPRVFAPFILSNDVARGAMHAGQALLDYALMLAVMTFHVAYIISIIVGTGVGEVLFGRWRGLDSHH